MPLYRRLLLSLAALAFVAGASVTARADIIITAGPSSAGGLENILFNEPGLISTGTTVQGVTNMTGVVYNFTANTTVTTPSGGQARIEDADLATQDFTQLTFLSAPTSTFTVLTFNVNSIGSGNITVTGVETNGQLTTMVFTNGLSAGENFFRVEAINGQILQEVRISVSGTAIQDVRQIRVGGVAPAQQPIPEPMTMILLGTGLAGVAGAARRKRRAE